MSAVTIRKTTIGDGAELLQLMRQLAEFEGYGDKFVVTKEALATQLYEQRRFEVFVAEVHGKVVGMLVYYYLPFTYDLTPWAYIKELYVDPEYRAKHIGKKLMVALAGNCAAQGGGKIRWDVLASNTRAKAFYESLGAAVEEDWELFSLTREAILALAEPAST